MSLLYQCFNQKIACLGLLAPLLNLIGSIIIAIVGFPVIRSRRVSDLEEARDQLFEKRSIEVGDPGFNKVSSIIDENTINDNIEPYTHQDQYQMPEDLFENIVEINVKQSQQTNDVGEQVIIKHGNPEPGEIPLYDVGSPLAVSNWINTKIEKIQYNIIVRFGFPLLLISFTLQTIVYWYTNIS